MCAIAGLISAGRYLDNGKEIYKMADSMSHRGPDAQGFACFVYGYIKHLSKGESILSSKVALGFDRLSIRDVSENGMQPMISHDGKVAILFNGELYNADEMMKSLEDYDFRSSSDTEVILAYYLKYGINKCISALNGMFAICILDCNENKIYLCRDGIGIKPLYYTVLDNGDISFASEIKAFLCNEAFSPELNLDALREYFTFGDPVGGLLLGNVTELCPGTIVTINLYDNEISETKFFDIDLYAHSDHCELSENEVKKLYESTIMDVIKRQLVSDVSVGVQCSGGVDSSLVAYYVSRLFPDNFAGGVSIICDAKDYSEESYIDIIARKADINIYKFLFDNDYVVNNIERAVYHYETIITYHNLIALLRLAEMSKQYISVLLSGEGADELFAGYTWFEDGIFASKVLSMKRCTYGSDLFHPIENTIRGLKGARSFGDFAISCTDNISPDVAGKVLKPIGYEPFNIYNKRLAYFNSFHGNDFDKHVKYEMSTRLRALLMRQDKACMAYSVENRVPFLDNEMIKLAFSTPRDILIQNIPSDMDRMDSRVYHSLKGKAPLKKLCNAIYGEQFAYRRKVGFPLPFHQYMSSNEFQAYVFEKIIPNMKRRGVLDADYVRREICSIKDDNNRWRYAGLWKAITFEIFCQQFLDKKSYA